MSDDIVIDETIVEQLNRGNADLAKQLRQLIQNRANLWMARETYATLSRIQANKQLFKDLGVNVALQRVQNPAVYNNYPHRSEPTGLLALERPNARLMTMNRQFSRAHQTYGGAVLDVAGQSVGGDIDYNRARTLLGLRPLRIAPNGQIVPQADPKGVKTGSSSTPVVKTKPTFVDSKTNKPASEAPRGYKDGRTGSPIAPVKEHRPNPTPKTNGAVLALRGINFIVQGVNDSIQQERLDKEKQRKLPVIEETLTREPSLGVLMRFFFSRRQKMGAEHETPLTHTAGFQFMDYEYGYTKEDAAKKFQTGHRIGPAGAGEYEVQEHWIPPQQPISPAELPTPFPAFGLATFVPGKEELIRLTFRFLGGFDDKLKSVFRLKMPANRSARFLVMFPPNEVHFLWGGKTRTDDLVLSYDKPAEVIDAELVHAYLPVMNLDSRVNPYDAKAVWVYPADDDTVRLFQQGGRIDDGDQLKAYQMNLVRFVKPHKIRLLKVFGPSPFSP